MMAPDNATPASASNCQPMSLWKTPDHLWKETSAKLPTNNVKSVVTLASLFLNFENTKAAKIIRIASKIEERPKLAIRRKKIQMVKIKYRLVCLSAFREKIFSARNCNEQTNQDESMLYRNLPY